MSRNAVSETETIRPLSADDLESVIAMDQILSGRSRRGFFEKRLAAALRHPGDYVYVGMHDASGLIGYAMARLIDGEFGKPGARATLDAIGVAPGHQSSGAGHRLLDAVKAVLRHKKVGALESQVDWSDRALLGFFGDTGFILAPRIVLIGDIKTMAAHFTPDLVADTGEDTHEPDFSSPLGDQPGALSQDRIPVRSMTGADLETLVRIDKKLSGVNRRSYFERKQQELLVDAGIRVSLVAEVEGLPVGFIMARVDFGEFGVAARDAVMDTLGVHPDFQGQGVGHALMAQLLANLSGLQVDHLRSEIDWNDVDVIAFFSHAGLAPAQRVSLLCSL